MPKSIRHTPGRNILIVEDSQDFSNLLKFIVEDDGFVGIQFPLDGTSIVEWAKEHKPAVVLMDLTLRRKPGMDFIEDLKAEKETKHIPIIIITGRELSQREIVGFQLRDIGYLRKGRVELDEIRAEIRKAAGVPAPKAAPGKTKPA